MSELQSEKYRVENEQDGVGDRSLFGFRRKDQGDASRMNCFI